MTFADDFLQLETPSGVRRVPLSQLGMDWPPPELVIINEVRYERDSFSSITDEQREQMTHVCRGARYVPVLNS